MYANGDRAVAYLFPELAIDLDEVFEAFEGERVNPVAFCDGFPSGYWGVHHQLSKLG